MGHLPTELEPPLSEVIKLACQPEPWKAGDVLALAVRMKAPKRPLRSLALRIDWISVRGAFVVHVPARRCAEASASP